MKTWNSAEAKTRLDEILKFCTQEPQMICQGNKPAGVMIDIAFFNEVTAVREYRPSISELLDELDEIKKYEPADIEIPERRDRIL
jgi:hypothetical protein